MHESNIPSAVSTFVPHVSLSSPPALPRLPPPSRGDREVSVATTTLAPLHELHEREVACVWVCVCVQTKASHLLEDKGVNSPHTCCARWITLPSLSIHPATHVSLLLLSLSPSITPPLSLPLSGLKIYPHPCYLTLTGPQSDYTCLPWLQVVCACVHIFGELIVNNPLHKMWHLFKLIQPQITIFFMGN